MNDRENDVILAIDEELAPRISMDEAEELKSLQKKFVESYLEHKDSTPVDEWLRTEMAESLPDCSAEEVDQMRDEIIYTLKLQEEKIKYLEESLANGRSNESLFAI